MNQISIHFYDFIKHIDECNDEKMSQVVGKIN